MSTLVDIENCYRYILGRGMNSEETAGAKAAEANYRSVPVDHLRRQFLQSVEFHQQHLETLFENLVPSSIVVRYETTMGFRIYLDLRQLHLAFGVLNGGYEQREIDILRQIVADDATFYDVGANVGYFTLAIASRTGFAGKIFSFEPLAPLVKLLKRSVCANGLAKTVMARRMALGAARGKMALTDAEHSINAGSTRLVTNGGAPAGARTVQVECLDTIAADHAPDVIKVDIEGAEWLFFQGGAKTFETKRPTVLFEVNPELLALVSGVAPARIQEWLTTLGYRLWLVEPHRLRPVAAHQDLAGIILPLGVGNVLAIHPDRLPEVQARLSELRE